MINSNYSNEKFMNFLHIVEFFLKQLHFILFFISDLYYAVSHAESVNIKGACIKCKQQSAWFCSSVVIGLLSLQLLRNM